MKIISRTFHKRTQVGEPSIDDIHTFHEFLQFLKDLEFQEKIDGGTIEWTYYLHVSNTQGKLLGYGINLKNVIIEGNDIGLENSAHKIYNRFYKTQHKMNTCEHPEEKINTHSGKSYCMLCQINI